MSKCIDEIKDENCDLKSDPIEIANIFNTFFSKIAMDLKINIPPNNFQHKISRTENSMFFPPISVLEIKKTIQNLKNSKAKDIYNISTDIIKCCAEIIAEPLCELFQCCVDQGVFPSKLKISKTIPIFKKGQKNDPNNYRPIAILPIISKIFEKIMCQRLMQYVESMLILSKDQHGFRKQKNTPGSS